MAKKFADLTAQVKTEKRFSRRLDYPTATAAASSASNASAADRLSPVVVATASQRSSSASSSPSSVSRVTVSAPHPPQVVVEAAGLQQGQQQMRAQFHVHHEHLVRISDDLTCAFSRVSQTVLAARW